MTARRGRPKQYDAETVLRAAGKVFWAQGFSGTSLDDLSAAMGMNRPSIYRAFGDKASLYRMTLGLFGQQMEEAFATLVSQEADLRKGLKNFYRAALDVYSAGDGELGCMVMCTAPAAAVVHPEVQAELLGVIAQLDQKLLARITKAIEQGQLPASVDTETVSKLLQAVLHSLAIRARAGESKAALRRFAEGSVVAILGDCD